MNEELETLKKELAELKDYLADFVPLTVDLRIDGKVRPVVILAKQAIPRNPVFTVVN